MNLRFRIAQFFEKRWWRQYLKGQDQTSYLNWKKSYWRQFLLASGITLNDGEKVLDAGCGPAGIFIALDTLSVDAIDPLLENYEQTLPHFQRNMYPHVRFFNSTIEEFSTEEQYDTIFCLNAINHVAQIGTAILQLFRLAKPGARLVMSTDVHRLGFVKKVFQIVPGDILHPHQYDAHEYVRMLESAGFMIEKTKILQKGLVFNYVFLLATKPPLPSRSG